MPWRPTDDVPDNGAKPPSKGRWVPADGTPDDKPKKPRATAGDYLKAMGAGVNDAALTVPGQALVALGAEGVGRPLVEAGQRGAEYWQEQMTPAAQQALRNPFLTADGFGDTPFQTAALAAAQSLPGTAAMAIPGVGATRALRAARVPGRVAKALGGGKTARKVAKGVAPGLGFGASEGVFSGLSGAAQSGQEVRARTFDELRRESQEFRDLEASGDPALTPEQRAEAAREELAGRIEGQVGVRTALSTGAISAVTGGGALRLLEKPGKSALRNVGQGAAVEAIQETPQSAGEQQIQNTAMQRAGVQPEPGSVLNAAALGGAAGGILGGVAGGAGSLMRPRGGPAEQPPTQPDAQPPAGALPTPEQDAAAWVTLPDGQRVPRNEWAGYPDGTVARRGEIEARAAELDRQAAASTDPVRAEALRAQAIQMRAQGLGMGAQPAEPAGPVTRALAALPAPAQEPITVSTKGEAKRAGIRKPQAQIEGELLQAGTPEARARVLGYPGEQAGNITRADGTPFKTRQEAEREAKKRGLDGYAAVTFADGFALSRQTKDKRQAPALPAPSKPEKQAVPSDQVIEVSSRGVAGKPGDEAAALKAAKTPEERARILGYGQRLTLRDDGKPFADEKKASTAIRNRRLDASRHRVVPVAGGFAIEEYDDAQETVRSDQGQAAQAGDAGTGGEEQRGSGVQQPAPPSPGARKRKAEPRADLASAPQAPAGRRQDAAARQQAEAQGKAPAVSDRRKDAATRRRVDQMTPDEMRQALLTDDLTGLPNRRAHEEAPRRKHQASIDVDSLKFINDNFGHEAGDALLRHVGEALKASGAEAYRRSGDEFIAQGDDAQALAKTLDAARASLADVTLEYTAPDGTVHTYTGPGFSYGIGTDEAAAEERLKADKSAREATGTRAARGEKPQGVAARAPEGRQAAGGEEGRVEATQEPPGEGASPEPKAPSKSAITQARREVEREAFAHVTTLPDVQQAAAKGREAFDAALGKALKAWRDAETAKADDLRLRGLRTAEQTMLAEKFRATAFKEAQRLKKQADLDAARDPDAYRAALDGAREGIEDPAKQADFELGWKHALAGKTKSTLSGGDLAARMNGYQAARAWMRTEEGAAWFEGRPVRKLENTGADLRRWYEQMRAEMKDGETDITRAMRQIEAATNRARLFAPLLPDGVTPGFRAYIEELRSKTATFREFLGVDNNRKGMRAYVVKTDWHGAMAWGGRYRSDKTNWQYALDGERYPGELSAADQQRFQTDEAYRIRWFQDKAGEYLDQVRDFIDFAQGASSVREAAEKFTERFVQSADDRGNVVLTDTGKNAFQGIFADILQGNFSKFRAGSAWTETLIEKEQTLTRPTRATPLTPPKLDRITRDGPQVRSGDVTPQAVKTRFGLADVGFGKWVGAQQDQDHLNYTHDAFADIAAHIGTARENIGFGGRLHFTIGALGRGKHAAHFSPNQPHPDGSTVAVINVTNTRGDGTVLHEWVHALDSFLGGEWKSGVRSAFLDILKRGVPTVEDVENYARQFLFGTVYWRGMKDMPKSEAAVFGMRRYAQRRSLSAYKANADKLGADYWGNDAELIARAFEAWGADTLGHVNDYLVNSAWVGDGAVTPEKGYRGTPYPSGAERRVFNEAITALVKAIRWEGGRPTVTREAFNKSLPDHLTAGEKRRLELSVQSNMDAFYEEELARRADAEHAERAAREDAARREQEEMDRLAAEAVRALVDAPQPSQTTGPLNEDDLNALFDEAAAELRESAQEKPDAPEPGEPTPRRAPSGQSASPQEAPGAADLISKAAQLGVKGADEALKGLAQIFGGPGKLNSFPGGFDEETYQKAKPHFQAALKSFQDAGKTLKDLFKLLIQQFGDGVKAYAIRFAQDEGLTASLGGAPSASMQVAARVEEALKAGTPVDWRTLFGWADAAFGGTQAEGKYTPKDAYDAAEAGMNRYILANPHFTPNATREAAATIMAALTRATELLPTQTKRTAEQDAFQQFSTVPALAYLANWAANVTSEDVVLEPSAGIGGLAVFARNAGARVVLNELSSRRAAVLQEVLPSSQVFTENAEQIDNVLPAEIAPTVVVMNPPFSAAGQRGVSKDTAIGARHVEQALARLEKGGRLVAIVGEGMGMDRPAFKAWWKRIGEKHAVRAAVPLDGSGYAKYGTTFNNVLIVIDKVPPTGAEPVTGSTMGYEQALVALTEVHDGRPELRATVEGREGPERDAAESARDRADEGEQGASPGAPPGGVRSPRVGGGRAGRRSGVGGSGERGRGAGRAGEPGGGVSEPDGRGPSGGEDVEAGRRKVAGDSDRPAAAEGGSLEVRERSAGPAGELTDSVFESYRPQRLEVPGAQPHPGPLVESAAMASVLPPAPKYAPNLPKATIEKGLVSIAQVEAVVYAGEAHEQMLTLTISENRAKELGTTAGAPLRRGFFIGDGTGVGKGREIAAIILDNLRRGRKKNVWVSEKQGLFKDAKRDMRGIGGPEGALFKHSSTKADGTINVKDGVLFTTYSMLRSEARAPSGTRGKTRVEQIAEWLGPDFDGVIVFDEAHNAGNAQSVKGTRGASKPAKQALAVVELQDRLPNARVVYVSATGATEVSNLSFATRLGIWGPGTAFPDAPSFVKEMDAGGLAAMELVARDLKQTGSYIARSLSYDGVVNSTLEHPLSPLQRDIYDRLAEAWQTVLRNVNEALAVTGVMSESGKTRNGNARSAALSAFWGSQQRFFNQIITSMQMPTAIESAQRDMADGYAVLFQLVNTNEAQQARSLAKIAEDETGDLEDLDLTPRDVLIQYVERSFPVQEFEEYTDDSGNIRSRPVTGSDGSSVLNRQALAMRDRLLQDLRDIRVPDGPLEIILNAFGQDAVAEVTGRTQRVVRKPNKDGNVVAQIEKRSASSAGADAAAFMDGRKQILVFSDAGGTGYSFHADRTAKNKRKRKHYLVQPGWRANKAMQGMGRSHRSNQASPPHYVLLTTDVPAQKRFVSSIARRLNQLGALTRGQRETTSGGLFSEKDNLESKYAQNAVRQFFEDLRVGLVPGLSFANVMDQFGLQVNEDTLQTAQANIPDVRQFLNRTLSLTLDMQKRVFDAFYERLSDQIESAAQRGDLETGMQTIRALETRVVEEEVFHVDERTGADTRLVELELTQATRIYDYPGDVEAYEGKIEWVKNAQSGRVWAKIRAGNHTDDRGAVVPRYRMLGTGGIQFKVEADLKGYTPITEEDARQTWAAENAKRDPTYTQRMYIVVGTMLPIWDRIPNDGAMQVVRTQTVDGRRLLGVELAKRQVEVLRRRFDLSAPEAKLPPAEVMARILKGEKAELANGWRIERARVSAELRVEINAGYLSAAAVRELTDMGVIVERISWTDRLFVPNKDVLAALLKSKPLVSLSAGPMASRTTGGAGRSVDSVRADLEQKLGKAALGRLSDRFVIVRDTQALRDDMQRRGSKHASQVDDTTKGLYDPSTQTSYIVAGNLAAGDSPWGVFLHEVGEHYGLERMLGREQHRQVLRDVTNLLRAGVKPVREAAIRVNAAESVGLDPTAPNFVREFANRMTGDARLAREVLAYLVENPANHNMPMIRRMIAAARAFLVRMGVRLKLNTDDLVALVSAAARKSGGFARTAATPAVTDPQTADAMDALRQFGFTAKQEGGKWVIRDANGKVAKDSDIPESAQLAAWIVREAGPNPSRGFDVTQTAAFKRWFGKSKAVDAEGRPLVVYHGTTRDFSEFRSSKQANGLIFLAFDAKDASDYALLERAGWGGVSAAEDRANVRVMADANRDVIVGGRIGADVSPRRLAEALFTSNIGSVERIGERLEAGDISVTQAIEEFEAYRDSIYAGGNVMPMLVKAERPYGSMDNPIPWREAERRAKAIRDEGYDSIYVTEGDGVALAVFRPEQIKSIFNRGTFDPNDPNILFSRVRADDRLTAQALRDLLKGKPGITREVTENFNAWDRWLGTLDNLVRRNPAVRPFFQFGKEFQKDRDGILADTNDVVSKWNAIGSRNPFHGQTEQQKRVGDALLDGTLRNRVWSDDELRQRGLTAPGMAAYKEIRGYFERATAEYRNRLLERYGLSRAEAEALARDGDLPIEVVQRIGRGRFDLAKRTAEDFRALKGYFPLMRFGRHTVSVIDREGNLVHFETAENALAHRRLANDLRGRFDASHEVRVGKLKPFTDEALVMDTRVLSMLRDYAEQASGLEDENGEALQILDDLEQAMLKTLADQSFKKHRIHRKGVPGFSRDIARVMANYGWSSANFLAKMRWMPKMESFVRGIDAHRMPDVKAHLERQIKYIRNPGEEFQAFKSATFAIYMGLNVKSALVNLTQIPVTLYPYLANRHGDAKAMGAIRRAMKDAASPKRVTDRRLRELFQWADHEGLTMDLYLSDLIGAARGKRQAQARLRSKTLEGVTFVFSEAEKYNRRVALAAAYHLNKSMSDAELRATVQEAITKTQFDYGRFNRPTAFRGVGSIPLQFQQFMVNYLQFLAGNGGGVGATARSLAVLVVMAGLMGLPFAEDVRSFLEYAYTKLTGKHLDMELAARQRMVDLYESFGADPEGARRLTEMSLRGGFSMTPFDITGSVSVGRVIPGFKSFFDTAKDQGELAGFGRAISDAAGPMAGYGERVARGAEEAAVSGDVRHLIERAVPSIALSNAIRTWRVAREGVDRDYAGRVRLAYEPKELDILAAALSFTPGERSRLYRIRNAERREGVFLTAAHQRLIVPYAVAIAERDPARRQEALKAIQAWNREVPAKWKLPMSKVIRSVQARRRQFEVGPKTGAGTTLRQLQPAIRETRTLYPTRDAQ